MSTRFMRKVWNGSYHSRSQWVWGTTAMRRGLMGATIRRLARGVRRYHAPVSAAPWTPHLPPGTDFAPSQLAEGGTLPARWGRRWSAEPSRPVLEGPDGRWDAGRLDERTRAAAAGLAAAGLAAGERLLWAPAPTLDSIAACLGALRLGAVVVPVNPALSNRELDHVVADVRPALAVADDAMAGRLTRGRARGWR